MTLPLCYSFDVRQDVAFCAFGYEQSGLLYSEKLSRTQRMNSGHHMCASLDVKQGFLFGQNTSRIRYRNTASHLYEPFRVS